MVRCWAKGAGNTACTVAFGAREHGGFRKGVAQLVSRAVGVNVAEWIRVKRVWWASIVTSWA
eukprot:2193505-Prymnesium_polylepis.1